MTRDQLWANLRLHLSQGAGFHQACSMFARSCKRGISVYCTFLMFMVFHCRSVANYRRTHNFSTLLIHVIAGTSAFSAYSNAVRGCCGYFGGLVA